MIDFVKVFKMVVRISPIGNTKYFIRNFIMGRHLMGYMFYGMMNAVSISKL